MFTVRLFRPSRRPLLAAYLLFSYLVAQGLGIHVHTFADHEPKHGHSHAMELHVDGMPSDSGHDGEESEAVLGKYAILKIKFAYTYGNVLPVAAILFLFVPALTGRVLWGSAGLLPPTPGGDARTPPLRAPPL